MPDEEIPGTPVLRADACEDEEHRPEEKSQDGEDTLAQQPDLLDEVHASGEADFAKLAEDEVRLVCPVCGLSACWHNLPFIAAKED